VTALLEVGCDYVLSYEQEDPVMSRKDGCEKRIGFLKPLIINAPLGFGVKFNIASFQSSWEETRDEFS